MNLTDTQLGFLFGTAFSVLYAVVGVPLGRISDALSRTKLMSCGIAFWSFATVTSGVATTYPQLAGSRMAVGLGEAVCNPSGHSLVADYFPQKNRAAAMGVLLVGTYAGMGASLFLGGMFLQHWTDLCHHLPITGACGVASWRAAFLAIGLPGLILAIVVYNLTEPQRTFATVRPRLGALLFAEFSAAVPPLTFWNISRAGGVRALSGNLVFTAFILAMVFLLGSITGDWAQWASIGVGAYAVSTWGQSLSLRDRPLFRLTYGCPTFILVTLGLSLVACINVTVQVWAAPYAMRAFSAPPAQVGVVLGLVLAIAGALGVTLGGRVTDLWLRTDRRAPIWMGLVGLVGPIPALLLMVTSPSLTVFGVGFFVFGLISQVWVGGAAALVQDLSLPRMRGTAAAAFSLAATIITSGLGPYWAGKISTLTGSLRIGLLSLLGLAPIALLLLLLAARRLQDETASGRRMRAEAAGEPASSIRI